jgi:hypothetical protein
MKLILITLVAVVVGMMVACGENAPPTPSISEAEAIGRVKEFLGAKPYLRGGSCLALLRQHEKGPFTATVGDDGIWTVQWRVEDTWRKEPEHRNDRGRTTRYYLWDVYPETLVVNRTDTNPPWGVPTNGCP